LENGQEVIYEAAFQANRTLILLDILVKNGEKWDAFEVKSSKALSETYYKDAALQYYVLINAGIKIKSFTLININPDYELIGEINIKELFVFTDVTEEVKNRFNNVHTNIEKQINALESDHSPKLDIGEYCFTPYDCDFIGHCWKNVKKPSIFDIPSLQKTEQFEIYSKEQFLKNTIKAYNLNPLQQLQIKVQISRKEHIALSQTQQQLLDNFSNNSINNYTLKILNFTPALPIYQNTKPYQQIAFAYALLPINGGLNDVKVFIAGGKNNPNNEVIFEVKKENTKYITYNNLNSEIESIDLQNFCNQGNYYHPAMQDYSNKSLSKALGIKPAWKSIESDIVAAQYYDDILRGHKDSDAKLTAIEAYLRKEVLLIQSFIRKLKQ
jgi:hypothetical protein